MRIKVNGLDRLFGNAADKPAKEVPGVSFTAFDTKEIFVYDDNGDPQLMGAGGVPGAHTHLEADITDLKSYTERVAVPASAGATGVAGQVAFATGFAYFCIAANTWERVVIATWV